MTIALVFGAGLFGNDKNDMAASGAAPENPPVLQSDPILSGLPNVGNQLSVSTGAWLGTAPLQFTYAWQKFDVVNGVWIPMSVAQINTLTLTISMIGVAVRCSVMVQNPFGFSAKVTASLTVLA